MSEHILSALPFVCGSATQPLFPWSWVPVTSLLWGSHFQGDLPGLKVGFISHLEIEPGGWVGLPLSGLTSAQWQVLRSVDISALVGLES